MEHEYGEFIQVYDNTKYVILTLLFAKLFPFILWLLAWPDLGGLLVQRN